MQERNRTKLILDIVLTILFIALLYAKDTGFTFHEIAGLVMGGLLIYHIVLNWSWVKSITKNLFNPRMKTKPRLFYLLNTVSLLAVATIIITGVQISMVLFPSDEMISHTLVDVHKWVSYACIGLFGLHIVLHWQFIKKNVPKLFKAPARPAWARAGLSMAGILLILSLLYTQTGAFSKEISSANTAANDKGQQESVQNQDNYYADRPRNGHGHGHGWEQGGNVYYEDNAPQYSNPTTDDNSVTDSGDSLTQSEQSSDTSSNSSISSGSSDDKPSLNTYLSSLFCDACEKHCSLLSLRCDRGIPQLEAAQQQYQATYVQ
ncbi:MAG: putative rane protein [Firmicutes bacterium]|nr:putative rane protein [Bacillota bacterium]